MKFRLHPLLLTNIFLGIFSLIVTSAVADNAKKPYWQDVEAGVLHSPAALITFAICCSL